MYWQRDTTSTTRQHSVPSAEIEITSYALLALLTRDKYAPINNVMPIVRWLTKQRNAYGGFTSTQVRLTLSHGMRKPTMVSEQVQHKPVCAVTEDGLKLESGFSKKRNCTICEGKTNH